MKKIAFVIAYYGTFSNYFDLWLKSVEFNPTVDFLIVTDISIKSPLNNLKIIKMDFQSLRKRIIEVIGDCAQINSPYKLCDYKPMYGLIFEKELLDYDFWGYCDVDLILGDIRHFITDDVLNEYDKIFEHGHMTLFRNDDKLNRLFLHTEYKAVGVYDYLETISTGYCCHFDEGCGISVIARKAGLKVYNKIVFSDLDPLSFRFCLAQTNVSYFSKPQIYQWKSGKLFCHLLGAKESLETVETLYVHLQKRKMENLIDNKVHDFFIVPNQFVQLNELNTDIIKQYSNESTFYGKYIRVKYTLRANKHVSWRLKIVLRNLRYRIHR